MTSDLNSQVGKLNQTKRQLGGFHGVVAPKTDNDDRMLRLFLANGNFKNQERHPPTSQSSQRQTQKDHMVFNHHW